MTWIYAHAGAPPAPHDIWGAWNLDPVLIAGLALAGWAYHRGRGASGPRGIGRWRARCFAGAMVAVAVALVSPLDAVSSALASAHMAQHVLLLLVTAPLLALSAPTATLLAGSPPALRRAGLRWRRRLRLTHTNLRPLREPITVWLLHVAVLWGWHASTVYDAAVSHEALHVAEHASFLVTGLLFWRVAVGRLRATGASPGLGVLMVFTMALQSVFLSALLTFAGTPWYASYAATTTAWGLEPLADQQLAGVIMWVPAGFVYLGAALAMTVSWLRAVERQEAAAPS